MFPDFLSYKVSNKINEMLIFMILQFKDDSIY